MRTFAKTTHAILLPALFWATLISPTQAAGNWRPHFDGEAWRLSAVAGERRIFQAYGLAFDLVNVSTLEGSESTWTALGVSMGGDYVSFVQGEPTRRDVWRAVEPGSRLELVIFGPAATPQGIDWEQCAPSHSPFCRLARLAESSAPPYPDLPLPGRSNLFIHTGHAPNHPLYGFLIWEVVLLKGQTHATYRPQTPDQTLPE